MTAAATPAVADPTTGAGRADPGSTAFEARVRGESSYDRVTSMLMAVVVGSALIAGWLGLVTLLNNAYKTRVAVPMTIVDVGGGGGSPDGTPGQTEAVEVAGAAAAESASNASEEMAADLTPPSVEQTTGALIDPADVATSTDLSEIDIAPNQSGAASASGKRASKFGTGGPALGLGGTGDGIGRDQRWSIVYPQGQTADEYARQLDFFAVELAVPAGSSTLEYVSHFTLDQPERKVGPAKTDARLWFLWQSTGRKANDSALLKKAGIEVGDKPIFQFYPKGVEDLLARLEVQYRGRAAGEIRVTRFQVAPQGNGYAFQVVAQETIR